MRAEPQKRDAARGRAAIVAAITVAEPSCKKVAAIPTPAPVKD
ncbi:hypothetical protein M775_07190 [Neisseria gonorrhoeae MU_NG6]|nr:hypothetical protein M771_09420 [Neisseria gonorrhoeae MU_NG1]KLS88190.1 hypothetical protein M775_07190 [Neisseria gonorrhoeae MU_NG6]